MMSRSNRKMIFTFAAAGAAALLAEHWIKPPLKRKLRV